MSRIFLSHSSNDDLEAVALRDWLASEGWDDVFLDFDPNRGIVAGQRWEKRLHEAASRCEAVVFLVSGNWLASGWCMKEYTTARRLNKKLFAVLIDPTKTLKDLPPELTDTWQVTDLAGGRDLVSFRAVRPGTHEEKQVGFNRDGLLRLKRGLEKAGLDPRFFAWPPESDPGRAPYRGLKPLEAEDAGIFFGRDAPIIEAIDRLRGLGAGAPPRLMVILGASGAGKSSFLRAGLLPRLARDDTHFVVLPPIRPERAAISGESGLLCSLEHATGLHRSEIEAVYRKGAVGLQTILADLVDAKFRQTLAADGSTGLPAVVLAIDQAEELFRLDGMDESQALLALVRDLTTSDATVAVIVVFAIRSDSYDALEHAKALEGLRQATMPLLPMPRGAYKDVIEGPPRRIVEAGGKLAIEPQLTARLLEDIERGAGSDALPLLAFALEQLYLGHRGSVLKHADYEAAGGLRGAIDAAVERAFARADADPRIPLERAAREKLLRRGLIPWLAGIDPDTKSPRRNIARLSDIPDEAIPLVNLLVDERLLSTDFQRVWDPDTATEVQVRTIEPTHEALLRQWGLLEGWLAEDFGLLATLEGVQRASRDWAANGRDTAWLAHSGGRLAEAHALDARPDLAIKLDTTDRAYVTACSDREEKIRAEIEQRRREREEEQERRLADAETLTAATRRTAQRTRIGLMVAIVLAIAAGGFGLLAKHQKTIADQKTVEANAQTIEATLQKNHAETQEKQALAEKRRADANADEATRSAHVAQDRLRSSQQNESTSLAEQSLREGAAGDTSAAIKLALKALPADLETPDRPIVARAHYALEKAVWDHRLRFKAQPGAGQISNAIFSPDGHAILVSGREGWVTLIDAATGSRIWQVDEKRREALQSVFSANGEQVATLYSLPASIVVRNAADGAIVKDIVLTSGYAQGGKIALSPNAQRVYYTGGPTDRDVHVWTVATGRETATWLSERELIFLATKFQTAGNGELLVMTSHGGVGVFDAGSGTALVSGQTFEEDVFDIVAPNDGPAIFVRGRTKMFILSDGRQVSQSWTYTSTRALLEYIDVFSVSPDRKTVFLPISETEFAAFDAIDGTRRQVFKGHSAPIVSTALTPDGHRIAALAKDNSIRVWATDTGIQERLFKAANAPFRDLSFSPDSRSLLTYAGPTVYLWDVSPSAVAALPKGLDPKWSVLKIDAAGAVAVANTASDHSSPRVAIVDLAEGRIVALLDHDASSETKDHEIVFSPSNKLVAIPRYASKRRKAGDPVGGTPVGAEGPAPERWQKGSAFVEIRNTSTGDLVGKFASSWSADEKVSFSQDDRLVCLQTGKLDLHGAYVSDIMELSSGHKVLSLEHQTDAICTFSKHSVVLSSKAEHGIELGSWDIADGHELFRGRRILHDGDPKVQIVGDDHRVLVSDDQHPPALLDSRTGASIAALASTLVGVKDVLRAGPGFIVLRRTDESWALWDVTRRPPSASLHGDSQLKFVAASQDGRRALLRARVDETDIYRVVDAQTGALLFASAPTSYKSYKAVASVFSEDGKTLALQTGDRMVEVVPLTGPAVSRTISTQERPFQIKLTREGRWLVTFTKTGIMEAWDTVTGQRTYHRADIALDSPNLLSGAQVSIRLRDKAAELVDLSKGATTWKSNSKDLSEFLASRDGRRIFAIFPDRAVVYDLANSRELSSFPCDASKIFRAFILPDGVHVQIVASLRSGMRSALVDLESGVTIAEIEADDTIRWIPNRTDIFLIEESSGVDIRSAIDGHSIRRIKTPRPDKNLVLSPSGDAIAFSTKDHTIVVVDLQTGDVSPLTRLADAPRDILFGATKGELLVHDESGGLSLWDVATRRRLTNFTQPWSQAPVIGWHTRVDPSGSILAVASPDSWIRAYNVSTGAQIVAIPLKSASASIIDIAVLDQTILAVLTENSNRASLGFVDLATKKTLLERRLVGDFRFSTERGLSAGENNRLVAVASDGTVSLYSRTLGTLETFKSGVALKDAQAALSRDGRFLALTGAEGAFRLWDTAAHEVVDEWTFAGEEDSLVPTVSQDDERIILSGGEQEHIVRMPLKYIASMRKARGLLGEPGDMEKGPEKAGPRLGVAMRAIEKGVSPIGVGSGGVFLMEVVPDSPAYLAGLRPGDVIVDVRDHHVDEPQDVSKAVQESRPGAELPIGVVRDGRRLGFVSHL